MTNILAAACVRLALSTGARPVSSFWSSSTAIQPGRTDTNGEYWDWLQAWRKASCKEGARPVAVLGQGSATAECAVKTNKPAEQPAHLRFQLCPHGRAVRPLDELHNLRSKWW